MLKIDLHIHSVHSGHAYGTVYDIINQAKKNRMDIIALTDHGPSMYGTSGKIHFLMGRRAPKKFGKLRLLWGCEANLINADGDIDLSERAQNQLDLILLGVHLDTPFKDLGRKRNTEAIKKALCNPHIKIMSHPTNQKYFDFDFDEVCNYAIDRGVTLELNLAYLKLDGETKFEIYKRLVDIAKKRKAKLIVNTDSHFIHTIGDDSILKKYWKRLDLKKELILNNYPKELKKVFNIKD